MVGLRAKRVTLPAGVAVAGLIVGVGTMAAWAATGGSPATSPSAVFTACLGTTSHALERVTLSPAVRLKCPNGTTIVSWDQTGPQGPAGPSGPAGAGATSPAVTTVGAIAVVPVAPTPVGGAVPASATPSEPPSGGLVPIAGYYVKLTLPEPGQTSTGGAGAGKVTFTPVQITLPDDAASLEVADELQSQVSHSVAVLLYGPDGAVAVRYDLNLVDLATVTASAGVGIAGPQLELGLEVGSISTDYQRPGPGSPSTSPPTSALPRTSGPGGPSAVPVPAPDTSAQPRPSSTGPRPVSGTALPSGVVGSLG